MNKNTKVILGAVVIAVAFFYGGYAYAGHLGTTGASGALAGRMGGFTGTAGAGFARGIGGGRNGGAGGLTTGTVIARDAQSITVELQGGGSKIVFVSGSTQVMKAVAGSVADVVIGENVAVTASANSDGSLTAQSIQIRPARSATTTPFISPRTAP